MDGTFESPYVIDGSLSSMESIDGSLSSMESIDGDINIPVKVDADVYSGSYTVVPAFEGQTLETKNKVMQDDVSIDAILVSKTINISGGNTVYIGGEINNG